MYTEFTDTELAVTDERPNASSLCISFEVESTIFETDEKMQTELGKTVKSVLKHANGNGGMNNISATLFPFSLGM